MPVGSTTISEMDNLTYSYDPAQPNQLRTVSDGQGGQYANYGFKDPTASSGTYIYDANGNMITDPYKGLTLTYNDINRTQRITISASRYIDYTYDVGGTLLRKQTHDTAISTTTTTDYIDGFVYENNVISYFSMPEGRVYNSGSGLKVEYVIKDQQGNARINFEDNGSGVAVVKQENSYYGFGLALPSAANTTTLPNKNLYNGGSEWQNDFNDLPDLQQTFYRNYDAALGRFIGADPKAAASESITGYHYAYDNPIMFNDPMGDNPSLKEIVDHIIKNGTGNGGSYNSETGEYTYFTKTDATDYILGQASYFENLMVSWSNETGYAKTSNGTFYGFYSSKMGYIPVSNNGLDHNTYAMAMPDYKGSITYHWKDLTEAQGVALLALNGGIASQVDNRENGSQADNEKTDWLGVLDAGLGVVGGVIETAAGAATVEFGIGAFGIVDGGTRTVANSVRLAAFLSGHKDFGTAAPGNIGSLIGKFVDGKDFYTVGKYQTMGAVTNDAITMFLTGTSFRAAPRIMMVGGALTDAYTSINDYITVINTDPNKK